MKLWADWLADNPRDHARCPGLTKFDKDGYLYEYKACLVVQGDLQDQHGNTYAATLAARLF
jgi:hypothetical protein